MQPLIPIAKPEDILPEYRGTPIDDLIQYHNFKKPFRNYERPEILIGMCMDSRKSLQTPENFAFVIRAGGANLRYAEFKVSYAIAVGQVRHIALIGHNNCRMVNLVSRKDEFINGLVEAAGWDPEEAEEHFMHHAPMFEIGNEIDFILSETKRLRLRYPKIQIAPMMYSVDDNKLYLVKE